jgi:uncharacterized membrane protein
MIVFRNVMLVLATITTGLVAGIFYAYSISVMLALGRVDDRTFIEVMQRVNAAIQNGWFALSFLGAIAFTGVSAVLLWSTGGRVLWLVIAAAVLYVLSLVVTFGFNIPLNNTLDAAGRPDRIADPASVRAAFEASWVRWNIIRTLLATGSFACLCAALVLH